MYQSLPQKTIIIYCAVYFCLFSKLLAFKHKLILHCIGLKNDFEFQNFCLQLKKTDNFLTGHIQIIGFAVGKLIYMKYVKY